MYCIYGPMYSIIFTVYLDSIVYKQQYAVFVHNKYNNTIYNNISIVLYSVYTVQYHDTVELYIS